MLLLGIDLGTSSIKVSVVDSSTRHTVASATYPDTEVAIKALQPGWAEQSPDLWWLHVQEAIRRCHATGGYDPTDIAAIGISYQMHGLVLVDSSNKVLRDAIIWCDSRAIAIGEKAFKDLGEAYCLQHLLNSPGNFTASKLAWVKQNEPHIYEKIDKVLLPGDFIALKLTGSATTSASALSEGMFWDFKTNDVSAAVVDYFGFQSSFIPTVQAVFSEHGRLDKSVAEMISLRPGIPVSYKAGDQPNNALSLNVMQPGEVAATAGTSGVIYGVADSLAYDKESRINSFAHVNHQSNQARIGILLCINGTGIFNRWIRDLSGGQSYQALNVLAKSVPAGAEGLLMLPFGNGAERMLSNRITGAQVHGLDFNIHSTGHVVRAAQEGIAFAFRYGLDIMRENGLRPSVIRAGKANMFLSPVFTHAFVNATRIPVELHECDGSVGAALGAGIGAGVFSSEAEAFSERRPLELVVPEPGEHYEELYQGWKEILGKMAERK